MNRSVLIGFSRPLIGKGADGSVARPGGGHDCLPVNTGQPGVAVGLIRNAWAEVDSYAAALPGAASVGSTMSAVGSTSTLGRRHAFRVPVSKLVRELSAGVRLTGSAR